MRRSHTTQQVTCVAVIAEAEVVAPLAPAQRCVTYDGDTESLNPSLGNRALRAARAAGPTHKVLLYHFDGVEDLTSSRERPAARQTDRKAPGSRHRRVRRMTAGRPGAGHLADPGRRRSAVLDQAISVALYDP